MTEPAPSQGEHDWHRKLAEDKFEMAMQIVKLGEQLAAERARADAADMRAEMAELRLETKAQLVEYADRATERLAKRFCENGEWTYSAVADRVIERLEQAEAENKRLREAIASKHDTPSSLIEGLRAYAASTQNAEKAWHTTMADKLESAMHQPERSEP